MQARRPVGLYNLGNTPEPEETGETSRFGEAMRCFLNAAIQSLAHTPLLADFLKELGPQVAQVS